MLIQWNCQVRRRRKRTWATACTSLRKRAEEYEHGGEKTLTLGRSTLARGAKQASVGSRGNYHLKGATSSLGNLVI